MRPRPGACSKRQMGLSDRWWVIPLRWADDTGGRGHAGAVLALLAQARVAPKDLSFIASHGQTIWHEPGRATFQLGDGAVLAERVGVRVVSDFRARDVAAGGQGAPLVPLADVMLFGHEQRGRWLLNVG